MRVGMRFLLLGGIPLVALVLAGALLVATSGRAQAEIDISGLWDVTISGDYADTCKGKYSQSGGNLSIYTECEAYGTVIQTGTIDPSTGSYNLTGEITNLGTTYQVETQGIASPDGNSIGGTWTIPSEALSGTFVGTRQPEPPCSIINPYCFIPGTSTPTPLPETPSAATATLSTTAAAPTPTPRAGSVILPDTGSGPLEGGGHVPVALLLGAGALLAVSGLGLRLGKRWRDVAP